MRGFMSIALALAPVAAVAQTLPLAAVPDATTISTTAERDGLIAKTSAELRASGKGFLWQPLHRDGANIAAIEYWLAEGRPAIHLAEAEYATVLSGSGTLLTGGTMVGAKLVRAGFVDGDRIEGGTTRALRKGDTVLIPKGVPHSFGIPKGEVLVLLGIKVPTP
jgi:mannose-6-phosphate isomerase-like protein (cupin superfamily)